MAKNSAVYKYLAGADKLTAAMRELRTELRATIAERGVKGAIAPILVAAKRYAKRSERTGALRASLTTKTVAYPDSGKAVGLVGPDRRYYVGGKRASLVLASLGKADRPANYAHLIEYGHHAVAPIKGTSRRKNTAVPAKSGKKTWVPAKPFLRPAILTTLTQQADGFNRGIASGFQSALNKANRSVGALK